MAVNESSTIDLERSQSIKHCISCNELNDDHKYCTTCYGGYCQSCINISHKDHTILPSQHPVVNSFKLFLSDTCALHKNESLSMYCYTCKRPSCLSCVGETHDGHSMSTIQSLASQADLLYSHLIDALPNAKSVCAKTKAEYDNYTDSVDGVIAEIKGRSGKLHASIDEMEASMLQPLEKELNDVRKKHADNEKLLQEMEILTHLFKSASTDVFLQKAAFVSNCPALENMCFEEAIPEPVSFTQVQMSIPHTEHLIGSIKRWSGKPLQINESQKASNNGPVLEVISLKSVGGITIEGRVLPLSDGRKWYIPDTTFHKKSGFSSTDLSILDKSLKLKKIHTIRQQSKTWVPQVSIIGASDLLYGVDNTIWRLSTTENFYSILDTSPVTLKGMCYTSDGRLVLGLCDTYGNRRSLIRSYLMDDLKPLAEIEEDENGDPLFSSIRSITENSNGDLIVHNSDDLLCIDKQGSLRWKLKKDFGLFCFDKFSNIVVATDDEIRVLDCNGKYVKTLLTKFDFLTTPISLFIDIEGLLWIGQKDKTKVLRYWK